MTNEEALESLKKFTTLADDAGLESDPDLCAKILAVLICERKVVADAEEMFPEGSARTTEGRAKNLRLSVHALHKAKATLAKARGE